MLTCSLVRSNFSEDKESTDEDGFVKSMLGVDDVCSGNWRGGLVLVGTKGGGAFDIRGQNVRVGMDMVRGLTCSD